MSKYVIQRNEIISEVRRRSIRALLHECTHNLNLDERWDESRQLSDFAMGARSDNESVLKKIQEYADLTDFPVSVHYYKDGMGYDS